MSRYIIHGNGNGAEIDIPAETTSEEYGEIFAAFTAQHGKPGVSYSSVVKIDRNQVIGGIFYEWGLAGPNGAWYELFQWPENSDADVKAAEGKLRREQDVVRLRVITLKRVAFSIPQTIGATGNA